MLEIAMVVVLFGMVMAFGMPVFNNFKIKNDLDIARSNIVHSLRRAQSLSRSMENDSSWGVYVTTSKAIIFKGNSYEARDPDYDEYLDILSSFKLTGVDEIIFHKLSGNTSSTSSIVISSLNANESRTITINKKGTVYY